MKQLMLRTLAMALTLCMLLSFAIPAAQAEEGLLGAYSTSSQDKSLLLRFFDAMKNVEWDRLGEYIPEKLQEIDTEKLAFSVQQLFTAEGVRGALSGLAHEASLLLREGSDAMGVVERFINRFDFNRFSYDVQRSLQDTGAAVGQWAQNLGGSISSLFESILSK